MFSPATYPWTDPFGRFSWFKTAVFAAALAPALWLAWRAGVGWLGPRPWTEAIHRSGDWSLRFLWLSLAVAPVRLSLPGAARIMTARRLLGVTALAYALLHLALYVGDQAFDLAKVASEIAGRVYLTIGFVAAVGLAVLGLTSFDRVIRRMGGRAWRALHRIVYPLAALAALHFFMQSKLDATEPVLMAGALVWLLILRLKFFRPGADASASAVAVFGALIPAALVAAGATAGIEALWIGLKSGAPPDLILAANWDADLWPRPAHWTLAGGLFAAAAAAAVAAALRKRPKRGERRKDGPGKDELQKDERRKDQACPA